MMFPNILRKDQEESDFQKIQRFRKALEEAEAVIIGAGAGLSTSAGFSYTGERFQRYFSDFAQKYGFHDMYSGGFYPYETLEEHWAYWSRYIYLNRYMDPPKPVYENLLELVKEKDYFVLTTNVDHCFQKAGFEKERLFYTQGDYGLFQCSEPCCQETWDNEEVISEMVRQQKQMRIPTELVPRCPHCGKPLTMNLRSDDTFVQDKGWYQASERYSRYIREHQQRSGKSQFQVNVPAVKRIISLSSLSVYRSLYSGLGKESGIVFFCQQAKIQQTISHTVTAIGI